VNEYMLKKGSLLYEGKYRIDGIIGHGGLGITYKATMVQLDMELAIKELYLEGKCVREADNSLTLQSFSERRFKVFKDKFVQEGRALAKFKHPNLVEVRDIFAENNTVYLVMDKVEGKTLERHIEDHGPFTEKQSLSLITQIGSALKEIHTKGLLHKDIRPANIMITKEKKPILVGLGVAGQFDSNATTPSYTPMEQYIAQYTKKDTLGPSSDVYAIAATLYFCLTGSHPLSVISRKNEALTPPQALVSAISPSTNKTILKGMAMEVKERYATVPAFLKDLPTENLERRAHGDALPNGTLLADGKYRIDKEMGRGGFGITYTATLVQLDLKLAVKELFLSGYCIRELDNSVALQSLSAQRFNEYKQTFVQEAKVLGMFNHPNIVKVRDIIRSNNTVYLVMEYVEGMPLQSVIKKKGKLDEGQALVYARQIGSALEEIHEKGFLHKDVRPANVIISKQGKAILVGLGVDRDKVQNSTGSQQPEFAPMEQFANNAELGPHTDIYGLGATTYYAITGKLPISAFDRYYNELPSPKDVVGNISQQTSKAIMKAMAMKADDRYNSVEAFTTDFDEVEPVAITQRRLLMAAASILMVLCIGIFAVINHQEAIPEIPLKEHSKYMQLAGDLLEKGNYKSAASYYKGIIKTNPDNDDATVGLYKAESALSFNKAWWNGLDEEWHAIFRKAADFTGTPNSNDFASIFQLRELYCHDTPINSLAPVSNLINLTALYCDGTKVNSLEPITKLTNLTQLGCYNTPVNSLAPIQHLTNLTVLDCSSTQVSDLKPIENLTNLKELYISASRVNTLESVGKLKKLTELYCHSISVNSLTPVGNLTNLTKLHCYKTQVSDLQPLMELQNLRELYCYKTQVSTLEPLSELNNLSILHCYNTKISTLEPISGLKNLVNLYCSNTSVSTLEPISGLTRLSKLYCYNTRISTLEPVKNLHNLTLLHASNTQITTLEPIANLSNLNLLYCSKTRINNLNPISNLTNLNTLYCYATQINDLNALQKLHNIKELYCSDTQIGDIAPIANLHNLNKLYLSSTQVNNLEPLKNLGNLSLLHINNTPVNSLKALGGLSALRELDMASTPVNKLDDIDGLQNLTFIKASASNVSPQNIEAYRAKHRQVTIEF